MVLNKLFIYLFFCVFSINSIAADSQHIDILLFKIIQAYQVEPYEPEQKQPSRKPLSPKEVLGQALFFDPIISGPRGTSCATCHVRSKGSADGIRLAVGLGAKGVGEERLKALDSLIVPRNALPFFNRGSPDFRAFFWDGRVQINATNRIESPLGSNLSLGFDSLLAAATTFPIVEPDEMLGRSKLRGGKDLTYHAELVSDAINPDNFQKTSIDVYKNLLNRLINSNGTKLSVEQIKYRNLFRSAYPSTSYDKLNITHVGNSLAAYITKAFELESAPWDLYVKGQISAISKNQKLGATMFFGKGRCYVCHTGKQFSDFEFHGLALPQLRVGKHGYHLDYGRAAATSISKDKFTFRTPPLRNVTQTGPWGHNGVFKTLREAIEHHVNPIPLLYQAQIASPSESLFSGKVLASRSQVLSEIGLLTDVEMEQLIAFLQALSSKTVLSDEDALPTSVPSGNNEFIRK
ncbi:MAG: His-Xaa-Ser system-associated MauG-like protein [Methylophilaceae bacterium]|nr:His-Xaa-Ser system-associated MauG-like protein [Methylophilaceae bacterium]